MNKLSRVRSTYWKSALMAKDKANSHLRFCKKKIGFFKLVTADLWASRPLTFADSRVMFASLANILGAAARR